MDNLEYGDSFVTAYEDMQGISKYNIWRRDIWEI